MQRPTAGRTVLFVLISALLVATAVAFRNPPEPIDATGPTGATGPTDSTGVVSVPPERGGVVQGGDNVAESARRIVGDIQRRQAAVRAAAHRFLTAFFRYEVGELSPVVRRALRSGATGRFARRLLDDPPRAPARDRFPPQARLRRVDVAFVSPAATRAVVSGTARRGGLAEEFSFVFVRRWGTWLASGPGE